MATFGNDEETTPRDGGAGKGTGNRRIDEYRGR